MGRRRTGYSGCRPSVAGLGPGRARDARSRGGIRGREGRRRWRRRGRCRPRRRPGRPWFRPVLSRPVPGEVDGRRSGPASVGGVYQGCRRWIQLRRRLRHDMLPSRPSRAGARGSCCGVGEDHDRTGERKRCCRDGERGERVCQVPTLLAGPALPACLTLPNPLSPRCRLAPARAATPFCRLGGRPAGAALRWPFGGGGGRAKPSGFIVDNAIHLSQDDAKEQEW